MFGWSDLLQILRKPAAFSFADLYIIMFRLSIIFAAVGLFRSDMLLIFNMVCQWFSAGQFCLFAVSLSRQPHDILDFSFLLSFVTRFLDVTLANLQNWMCVSSEVITILIKWLWMISRSTDYCITWYTVLTRPNKVETQDILSVSRNHKKAARCNIPHHYLRVWKSF